MTEESSGIRRSKKSNATSLESLAPTKRPVVVTMPIEQPLAQSVVTTLAGSGESHEQRGLSVLCIRYAISVKVLIL